MWITEIVTALAEVRNNMSDPGLPVRSVDALAGVVEFVNGVQYSLVTKQRIR